MLMPLSSLCMRATMHVCRDAYVPRCMHISDWCGGLVDDGKSLGQHIFFKYMYVYCRACAKDFSSSCRSSSLAMTADCHRPWCCSIHLLLVGITKLANCLSFRPSLDFISPNLTTEFFPVNPRAITSPPKMIF